MLDQERIISVLELLNLLNQSNKIARKLLQSYFRSKKYIGSKDRKFISNSFWNILRHRYKIHWHLDYLNLEVTFEKEMMLELFFLNPVVIALSTSDSLPRQLTIGLGGIAPALDSL